MKSEEWNQEITGLSPLLAGLDRRMPHVVPDGYFEQRRLAGLPVDMPHSVPEGYFDQLSTAVVAKAKKEEMPAMKAVRGGRFRGWWAAAAASVVMAIGLQQFYFNDRNAEAGNTTSTASHPTPSDGEISDFLTQPIDALPASNQNQLGEALNTVTDDELQQYLQQSETIEKPLKGI